MRNAEFLRLLGRFLTMNVGVCLTLDAMGVLLDAGAMLGAWCLCITALWPKGGMQ